jgi:hypothetical protein
MGETFERAGKARQRRNRMAKEKEHRDWMPYRRDLIIEMADAWLVYISRRGRTDLRHGAPLFAPPFFSLTNISGL